MEDIITNIEKNITDINDAIESLQANLDLFKKEQERISEKRAMINPISTLIGFKRDIEKTHEDNINLFYNEFSEGLKHYVEEKNGLVDDEFDKVKTFLSRFILDNNKTLALFKGFIDNDRMSKFVDQLRAMFIENGSNSYIPEKPDITKTKEYEEFEKEFLDVIQIISKKKYQLNADSKEMLTEREIEERKNNENISE